MAQIHLFLSASLLLCGVLRSTAVQFCPSSSFKSWNGNCYFFQSYRALSWQDAQKDCEGKADNCNLVSIHSEEESTYVYNEMIAISSYNDYWIGLSKEPDCSAGDECYTWSDGTAKDYTNWAPGEPNDSGGTENCVEAYYTTRTWNDHSCTHYTSSYICKAPMTDGWQEFQGNEYYISAGLGDNSPNWYESRAWCMENGGDLASIASVEESDAIMGWAQKMDFKGSLWNGMNELDGMRTQWHWSDGSDTFGFNRWEVAYPRVDDIGALCGYQSAADKEGRWRNTHCNAVTHGFICKRKKGDTIPKTTPAPVIVGGYCPKGYTEVGNKCFRAHLRDAHTGHTWEDAMKACRQYSSGYLPDLASFTNELEQAYVTSLIQEASFGYWIGLYRTGEGNKDWRWTDNSPNDYKNWAPLEPSSYEDKCAIIWYFPGPIGTWASHDCSLKRGYICQVIKNPSVTIPTPPVTTPHDCGTDHIPYGNACYKFDNSLLPWSDANSRCSGQGGNLASIHSAAENAFIQALAIENGATAWIGFRDSDLSGEYKWDDDKIITYTNWGENEPSVGDGGGCVRLVGGDGTWEDAKCASNAGFICKKNDHEIYTTPKHIDGHCPDNKNWVAQGSYCYHFKPIAYKTWQEALEECILMGYGSNLASIHSHAENDFIYHRIMEMESNPNSVWLGLYKKLSTGGYGWTDLSEVQYENWGPGEPNSRTGEHCVELYTTYFPKMWNDNECDVSRGYVCKAPKLPTLPTVPTLPGTCPDDDWKGIGSYCYLFRPDLHMSWMNGRRYCAEQAGPDADLASISGRVENDFIGVEMELAAHLQEDTNFWVARGKKMASSPYHWVDGNPATWTNWEIGEPSSAHDNDENCVEMYFDNFKWNDQDCDDHRGVVCKTPIVPLEGAGGGMSSGDMAGLVIGLLLGALLIAIIVMVVLTKQNMITNPATRVRDMAAGFSNPFYSQDGDKQGIDNPNVPDGGEV